MQTTRRALLSLVAATAALPAVVRSAGAQSYPAGPIRLLVGFAPGSSPDILGRLMAQWLTDRLARPVIVENRTGAGSNIATEAVVRAAADGTTLLLISIANTVNATLYEKLPYDFIRDIAPVAAISRETLALEVNPSFPAKTVPEFIAYAKASPGKLSMATPGNGSTPHMAGELFKMMTGVDLVHVPYRGSAPALTDLIGGHVQLAFGPLTSSIEYVRSGKLRALAVSSATRSNALPDIPTIADFVPGYEASGWFGIGVPRNTPPEIINKLNLEANAGLADSKIQARLAEFGATALPGSPSDLANLIAVETAKWGRVVKAANLKPS